MSIESRTGRPALTTIFTPPPECATGLALTEWNGTTAHAVTRNNGACYNHPLDGGPYTFSPGLYCPSGYTVDTKHVTMDFAYGTSETSLRCLPSGFLCDDNANSCTSTVPTPVVAWSTSDIYHEYTTTISSKAKVTSMNSRVSKSFGSFIKTTRLTTVPAPVITAQAVVTLVYRQEDILTGISAAEGARQLSELTIPPPTLADLKLPANTANTVTWGTRVRQDPLTITAITGGLAALLVAVILLILRRHHARNLKRSGTIGQIRNMTPRRSEPIWKLGVIQVLPILIALPLGIFSVIFGLRRDLQEEVILRWESKDAVLRFMQVLSLFIRLCATTLAWGIAVDSGWLLLAASEMPARHFVRVWDMCASGGSYSSLLSAIWGEFSRSTSRRRSFLRWLLFVTLGLIALGADNVGTAMVGSIGIANSTASIPVKSDNVPFTSRRLTRVTGASPEEDGAPDLSKYILTSVDSYPHILRHKDSKTVAFLPVQAGDVAPSFYDGVSLFGRFDVHCQPIPITGNISFIRHVDVFSTPWIPNGFNLEIHKMDLKGWKFSEKPLDRNYSIRTADVSWGNWNNLTAAITVPWGPSFSTQAVYIFSVLRFMISGDASSPIQFQPIVLTNTAGGRLMPQLKNSTITWEHQLCRAEVPYQVGTIVTHDISRNSYPATPCTRHNSSSFCPTALQYRSASFSTTTWPELDAIRYLNATISDKNTAFTALQPFGDNGYTTDYGYVNPETAVQYCATCTTGPQVSKHFSRLVAEATSSEFQDVFAGSLMHALAATYRAQLPFFQGKGEASWAIPWEVSMVTYPFWLWLGVVYTWALMIIAVGMQMWVLKIVGVGRSGSTLSAAALVQNDSSPLKPLVERGYMHSKDDFDDDMSAQPEMWMRDLKMGVLPNDVYGIGYAGDVRGLGNQGGAKSRIVYEPVEREESEVGLKVNVETELQDLTARDRERGLTTGADSQQFSRSMRGDWS